MVTKQAVDAAKEYALEFKADMLSGVVTINDPKKYSAFRAGWDAREESLFDDVDADEIQQLIFEIKKHPKIVSEQKYNEWFIRIIEYGNRKYLEGQKSMINK